MNPLLLIVLLPLVDIVLLVWIGRHTSLGFALLLVAGGVAAGMALLRQSIARLATRPAKRSGHRKGAFGGGGYDDLAFRRGHTSHHAGRAERRTGHSAVGPVGPANAGGVAH